MSFRLAAEMLILGGAAGTLPAAEARVAAAVAGGGAMARLPRLGGGQRRRSPGPGRFQPAARQPAHRRRCGPSGAAMSRPSGAGPWGCWPWSWARGGSSQDDVLDLGVGIRVEVRVGQRVEARPEAAHPVLQRREGQAPAAGLDHPRARSPCEPGPWLLETASALGARRVAGNWKRGAAWPRISRPS